MKSIAWRTGALTALIVAFSGKAFPQSFAALTQTQQKTELHAVLEEARTAVIRLAAKDSAWSSRIDREINELIDLFRIAGDRDSIRYLQQHLREDYALEIRHVLDPADTPQDFAKRIAALPDDDHERDRALELIVTQQLERSMYSDALVTAARVSSPISRDRLRERIAVACYEKDERAFAMSAIDAVIQSALEPAEGPEYRDPVGDLTRFASELGHAGDVDNAARVLLTARLIEDSSRLKSPLGYAGIARVAVSIGETKMAREILPLVQSEGQRRSIEDALEAELALRADPDGREVTAKIADDLSRARVLVAIAHREANAGNRDNAENAFSLAKQAAYKDDQFAVFRLIDIAKAQIAAGFEGAAISTLDEALVENEKPRWEGDRLNGWSYAAIIIASMGDFARAQTIVARIDVHSSRAHALRSIAYDQTLAGQFAETKDWARKLKDPDERSSAFLGIGSAIIEQMNPAGKK